MYPVKPNRFGDAFSSVGKRYCPHASKWYEAATVPELLLRLVTDPSASKL